MAYNPTQSTFLVVFTVNGYVSDTHHSWELFTQRVVSDGTLPGGPSPLPKYGEHDWTNADALEVISDTYLLSYAAVEPGGSFFDGPYSLRYLGLNGQPAGSNGLLTGFNAQADTEFGLAINASGHTRSLLIGWGDTRNDTPDVYGRRYGLGLLDQPPPSVTSYYYFGGQRIAMRTPDGVYYLHGDHPSTSSGQV